MAGAALVASALFINAQQSGSGYQSAQSVAEPSDDLAVMLQALEQVTPQPATEAPTGGNFYTVQHGKDWPPLPCNTLGLPFWSLGDGFYVMDDRNVDWEAIQIVAAEAAAEAAAALPRMSMMSMMSSSYAYGNPVYLTNLTATFDGSGTMTANFSIGGGTNFVPYDILMTTNIATPMADWNWLGIGYTTNNYTFYGQSSDLAFYRLAQPVKTMTVGIGDNFNGECDVPPGLTDVIKVAGGAGHSLALKKDGTVVAWGLNDHYQTEVPTNLVDVAMISAGWDFSVALLTNGTVRAWGLSLSYFHLLDVPTDLTNAILVSAGTEHTVALRSDGTVVSWGYDSGWGETNVPAGLTNVTAISAGFGHSLAVSNGCVVAWGYNGYGQCTVPTGLSNVVDVAAGLFHSLALLNDGTVVAWGHSGFGETSVPAGLSNVVAIAAGGDDTSYNRTAYSMALKKDGTLVVWGDSDVVNPFGGLNNVIAIGGGATHALVLRTGPPTPVITMAPVDQIQAVGGNVTFTARGAGLYGVTYQWQTNGVNLAGATNTALTVTNIQTTSVIDYAVMVTDNVGMGSLMSSNASIDLVTAPVIVSQAPMPTNQVAAYHTNLSLSVSATAPGQFNGFPLHYQWQLNGTNVGANSTNYTFLVDAPKVGNYSVIVTNTAGSVTSLVWQVSITYVGSYIDVGTLAYHLSTNAVGRTNGISNIYNDTTELANWGYATYSETNLPLLTNSTWSTNFWLKGVQGLSATCIGFSNGLGGQGCVNMISPRHCIFAKHMHEVPGQFMAAFLDTNNVIYWRTNMQTVFITNDISVGILNADLPPSVGFLPVLPTNYTNYLPVNGSSIVQGIGMNQAKRLFGQPMNFTATSVNWDSMSTAPFGLSTDWNSALSGGDSSNPDMLLIGNQLVLVSHNWHGDTNGLGDGPNYASKFDTINQTMHYLSTNNAVTNTDYQLTPFALTNWPVIH